MREIKVGILVSYDYQNIKNSLPRVYHYADKITLAVDKDGLTWSGNPVYIEPEFWNWIENFDSDKKITVYKDSFYVEGLSSYQCDTRERIMLGKFMGDGGWHVQVDADEYFVDFKHFVDFLHYLDKKKKNVDCVFMEWVVLFKQTSNGYLFINNVNLGGGNAPGTALATTRPQDYACCRIISNPKKIVYPQRIVHDTLSRTEEGVLTKFGNWGHKDGFDTEAYFHFWKAINEKNYMFVRNFGSIPEAHYDRLAFVKAQNIDELMDFFSNKDNAALLKVPKKDHLLVKIAKLCVPPIVGEVRNWINHNKNMELQTKLTKDAVQ
jgi:hypothetical protein